MKHFLLGVSLCAIAVPSWAESVIVDPFEYTPEDVITLGQIMDYSNIDDLTSATSIITAEQLRARGQAYIADVLRTLPGISVNASGSAGGLTQLRLRGSEANHIVVLIDGVEVQNPTDGGYDFGGLRSGDVERIEVLRGEQSALYGSDAIGGVINIITRAGVTQQGWRTSVEAGSRDTFEGQISAVIPLGTAALSVNGNAFTTDGYDISGLGGNDDSADSRALNLGLNNVDLGDVRLSAKFGLARRTAEFDEDSDFDGRLNDTDSETVVDTNTARIDARFNLAGLKHLITTSMTETETDTRAGFATITTGTRQNANWAAKYSQNDHTFTALAEVEREEYEFEGDDDVPDIYNYGLAGDYQYTGDRVSFTASARQDFNSVFDNATTWRLGAGYAFIEFGGRVRASLGTGVKNPTLIELFGFFPTSRFTGNADLKPETSFGYNIGYDQTFGDFSFSADYFRSELEDEITTLFNPDFTTSVVNLTTESEREGVEFEARYAGERVDLRGSVTFLDTDENGVEELRRPDFIASATASYDVTDALNATFTIDHNCSQFDTDFATFSRVELDSFTLVGANLRYRLSDRVGVSLRGTNLLDEDYQEVVGYTSPGRAIFAGLNLTY